MNLLERAEVRRETFYKLTNSADIPEVPSDEDENPTSVGGRNYIKNSEYRKANIYVNDSQVQDEAFDISTTFWQNSEVYSKKIKLSFYYQPSKPYDADREFPVYFRTAPWPSIGKVTYPANTTRLIKYTIAMTNSLPANFTANQIFMRFSGNLDKGRYHDISKVMLEVSDVFNDWSQAPEDLGWTTDTLVPTQSNRYLWKFEYIYYSDGSVEITQPTNISIAGADGTNGQSSHVHFAFADNATGGGFSLTTPKAYMGWYADFNEAASNDPTKYRWSKWKGDQGAPGKPGADGKTSYFHMAYAESADGRTGFSFKESGQQYQGYYTDFTQTSSTDPTKYTWMDRRAGVEVGGVNLLRNSKSFTGSNITGSGTLLSETYQGCAVRYFKNTNPNSARQEIVQFTNCVYPKLGGEYVASFWAKGSGELSIFFYGDRSYLLNDLTVSSWGESTTRHDGYITLNLTGDWERYWIKYKLKTAPASATSVGKHLLFRHNNSSTEDEIYLAGVQLEEGNVTTPYTRNPEDIQSDIDSKADQTLTQEQLNALAEKNNLIKAEMEAKASIDTVNQWITAYQNYVNANDEARAESEKNLQEAAARILQLKTDVGALRQQWDFIDTYMSIQNEGLIIGKSDGSAFAKFANDRISLFSGSSEVMYISQGTLHIENGIFTKTIQIGRFRFETHPADKDMLVLRYLGG